MNKISILSAILAVSGLTGARAESPAEVLPAPVFEPQAAVIGYHASAKPAAVRGVPRGAAPATLAGKKYITYFGSFTNYGNRAGSMRVEQAGADSLLLRGFAMGYDVKAKYDAATGIITIPTDVPIGKTSAGAVITLFRLIAADNFTKYDRNPVTGTFDGDKFSFTDGLYATAGNSTYVWMDNIRGREANGTLRTNNLVYSTLKPGTAYEYPVYVAKTAANKIEVQGMSQWLYGHNYKVPFTITQSSNTAQLRTTDSVDWYKGSSDTDIRSCFMLYRNVDTVNSVSTNPKFNVVAGDVSTIKSQKILFEGYKKSGSNSWSGWLLNPFEITVDFNIYTAPVENVDTVAGIIYQVDPDNLTAKVTGCVADLTDADIQSAVTYKGKTYTVTEIAASAFASKKTVTRLVIPGTVRSIGASAFSSMSGLKEVHLPDVGTWCAIKRAGTTSAPFAGVAMFSSSDTAKWGKLYFEGIDTPNPTDIQIPEGVTDIRYAFYYYRPLKSVRLASTVKSIYYGFYYCTSLATATLNEGLEEMYYAFAGCSALKSVDVPRSMVSLTQRAFYNCPALENVTLHTGLRTIEQYAFYGCKGLTRLELPATLDSIGNQTFYNCSNITSVVCRATTPPAVYSNIVFNSFASKSTLSVPEQSMDAYKAADGWKNFNMFDTNVGVGTIDGADGTAPAIYYDLNGRRMNATRLQPGIYVKVQGGKASKIIIR